jgi:pimeloyl-ACP methyl ester carboxylesterase
MLTVTPAQASDEPTVVLVHSAWERASSWNLVAAQLRARGYPVIAPDIPLRTLAGDAAVIADVLRHVAGPVVLVGHSYGGVVISNAAAGAPNVTALVYIAGYAPEPGESTFALDARSPGPLIAASLRPVPSIGGGLGLDLYVDPLLYRFVLAQDVPPPTTAAMAATQRPLTLAALTEPSGAAAWKAIPSWYMVAHDDRSLAPATERFMAARAKATTVEIASSHAAQVSHPDAVTDLIAAAAAQHRTQRGRARRSATIS